MFKRIIKIGQYCESYPLMKKGPFFGLTVYLPVYYMDFDLVS